MATKLEIDRGTTYTIGVVYKKGGVATSLVGSTVRFTIKTTEYDATTNDSTALLTKNITDGNADGEATIIISPSDTATIDKGNYYYDIKVDEDSDGVYVYKIAEGKVKLDASPTNRLS